MSTATGKVPPLNMGKLLISQKMPSSGEEKTDQNQDIFDLKKDYEVREEDDDDGLPPVCIDEDNNSPGKV